MVTAKFDFEKCKGCGMCVEVCPKKIIFIKQDKFNKKGYYIATVDNVEKCIGCGLCAIRCPDSAIEVV